MAAQDSLVVTGRLDMAGGQLAPGEVHTGEQGRLSIRDREVWGTFQFESGGTALAGRAVMSVEGQLDAGDNGALYGTIGLVADLGGTRVLVWEGHWLAQSVRRAMTGTIVARGRERFAGRRLRLRFTDTGTGTAGSQQFTVEGTSRPAAELGVTGITTSLGGTLYPGDRSTDAKGRLNIRGWRVTGPVLLNLAGVQIRGNEYFKIDVINNAGDESTGIVYGPYTFTMNTGHGEIPIFEGHFGGRLLRGIGASKLVACGRGPFAGYKFRVDMEELLPTEANPHPAVYLMDGDLTLEEGIGVTGVSDSFGRFEPGQVTTRRTGRAHARNRSVSGALSLRIGETEITGTQLFRESSILDAQYRGPAFGSFELAGNGGARLWQGHWTGGAREHGRTAEMYGLGRGPFAGKRIYLKFSEVLPFEGNPSPQIYILDGVVNDVQGDGVTGFVSVEGGLAVPEELSRDELGRRRVRGRRAEGEWGLLLGDTEVGGRSSLEIDGSPDDRQSGPAAGRLALTDEAGTTLFDCEWTGGLRDSIPAGAIVGWGRNRFAGRQIFLSTRASADARPDDDASVLVLTGTMSNAKAGSPKP